MAQVNPSWRTVLVGGLLLPPLGVILLWLRRTPGWISKLLLTIPLTALAVVYLVYFFGLRMELEGSSLRPIFSFRAPERHYRQLEENRAAMAADRALEPALPAAKTAVPKIDPAPDASPRSGVYWTDFRGPKRNGNYEEMPVLTEWPEDGLKPLWKQPVGGGYGSFVIARGIAFTIEQRRAQEVLAAYRIDTGQELWTNSWNAEFKESLGGDGPRGTPTWHDGKVFALGAEGELRAIDAANGATLWRRNVLQDDQAANLQWGMATSPLVVDGRLVVSRAQSLAAYDLATGAPVWRTPPRQQAYVSPMLVTLAGQRQILHVSAKHLLGVAIDDGRILWEHAWGEQNDIKAAQPLLIDDSKVFVSGGYGMGSYLVQLTRANQEFVSRTLWQSTRMKNKFTSSVLYKGHIYGLDESILACLDAATGDLKWKGGRYGYGQLVLAGDQLYVLTEGGDLVLVQATPERHLEKERFAAISGKTWNHPALADGYLLVRNSNEMAGLRVVK